MAVSTKADKNLKKAVSDTLQGVPVLVAAMGYRIGYLDEMQRHRRSVLLFLLAELYKEDWGALKGDMAKALVFEESYCFSRREQEACLSMILHGVGHFLDGDYSVISKLAGESNSYDMDMLPFS